MNIEDKFREGGMSSVVEKEDKKSPMSENPVINVLAGTNTISITEEDDPANVEQQNSQENAVVNPNNFLPNGSKVNIDFGLNSLQFVIHSQDVYARETVKKETLSNEINNSNLNDMQKPKVIEKVRVTNEKSKGKQKTIADISADLNDPAPLDYMGKTKRKRGRPLKGPYIKKTSREKYFPLKHKQNNNADIKESVNEFVGKIKRRRKSRKMKDYVTDFNSSDEEETKPYDILMEDQLQFKRNLSPKKTHLQNHLKDADTFSMNINEKFIFENDFLSESSLEISESESEMSQSPHTEDHKHILEIGPENKTKLEIINTGELHTVEESENIIYHLVTTTGNTSTISELLVPNTLKNLGNELESFNRIKNQTSRTLSSAETKLKGKLERSYKRKLAKVKEKVDSHLNELRQPPLLPSSSSSSFTIPEVLNAASKLLTEEQLDFLSMQLKTNQDHAQSSRFSVREQLFSLALYQQSPSVYKYLTTVFHLPSKLMLERWLEGVAKADPLQAKRLMYHVYAKYIHRA